EPELLGQAQQPEQPLGLPLRALLPEPIRQGGGSRLLVAQGTQQHDQHLVHRRSPPTPLHGSQGQRLVAPAKLHHTRRPGLGGTARGFRLAVRSARPRGRQSTTQPAWATWRGESNSSVGKARKPSRLAGSRNRLHSTTSSRGGWLPPRSGSHSSPQSRF